jgi:hypothetical protein
LVEHPSLLFEPHMSTTSKDAPDTVLSEKEWNEIKLDIKGLVKALKPFTVQPAPVKSIADKVSWLCRTSNQI